MKTAKLAIGIISMVLSVFILFQSCAAGLVNTIEGSGGVSGTAGLMVGAFFIIAGIVGVATRNSTRSGGSLTAAGFYLAAALFGVTLAGNYTDLYIWAFLAWAFAAVFIVDAFDDSYSLGWDTSWWQKSWFITLVLIFFPPAGIVLIWVGHQFELAPKIITTIIFTLGFFIMIGSFAGSMNVADSQDGSGNDTASATATTPDTTGTTKAATTANSKTAPENKVYGPGETWTVDGQFSLTFPSATATADRNQFSEKVPAQVVILNYDYENIGVTKNVMDLYISTNAFKVIDGTGVMASTYPLVTTGNPQETPIGAKCVGAQAAYGLVNASSAVTVNVEVYGNNYKKYEAVFKLPVS